MNKVSIIIPSRNEQFLSKTIDDLASKASGEIEIIAVLDGYWTNPPLENKTNLHIIHFSQARGMRACINAGASIAKGKYIMKTDGHCMFAEGFDEVLKADCDDNWLCVPSRYSLDPIEWKIRPKEVIDYHYLDCPMTNPEYFQFHGVPWHERGRERKEILIDDLMSWQGSMWFMTAHHFHNNLHGLNEYGYGTFSQEPQEIGNKTWLGGGRIIINKKTWYAHLHKGKQFGRGYRISGGEVVEGHKYSAWYWCTNQWKERKHDIEWLFEKFSPMPRWVDNWRELLQEYQKTHPTFEVVNK